ncbi:hypothetical protein LWC35_23470 [Pseudonocardia kujensis]|uniref:hypothetical protein n=1 Tax=Pseudonocardia kujensis TaxID=1128675 RepID=UPI001E549B53|nr:hypothetical protein [Pseudonocardia kujensis]MCE0765843.1 hypothetical protein [Pseudonocardia kujensis]
MTADGGERSLGAPRFDVVLRGYDRRQVDEHVARLQRVLARMRADLDAARSHPFPVVGPPPPGMGPQRPPGPGGPMGPPPGPPPGGRPRPTPRPRPGGPDSPDMIGSFTDRMQSILQAAEEEAEEIRSAARRDARNEAESLRKQQESARTELAELSRQRDAVVAELTRLRGQLEGLLGAPTARFAVTPPASGTSSPPKGEDARTERPGRPSPRPKPAPAEGPAAGAAAQPLPGAAPSQTPSQSGVKAGSPVEETTVVRRPESGPGSAPGDLFRPASEARGENRPEPDDEAEPATAMVPLASSDEDGEKPGPPARQVEPDRTVAVSAVSARPSVKRSGDTGSAEKSGVTTSSAGSDTPGDTPTSGAEPAAKTGSDEVSETVKVGAVRPAPAAPGDASKGRNGRSGPSDEPRGSQSNGERNGAGTSSSGSGRPSDSDDAPRSDRSTSGSRSG